MKIKDYAQAGFTADLLPIIPPDATISASSQHPEHLAASRGKVPGKQASDGWVGFGDWTSHVASESDVTRWSKWGGGVGLQGRNFPGLDNDVERSDFADLVEVEAFLSFGHAPARFRGGSRRLLAYAGQGLKKRRLAFTLPGRDAGDGPDVQDVSGDQGAATRERPDALGGEDGHVHAVELLATGQQYVVEGINPKSGKAYFWRDDVSPATVGPAGLTVITQEQVDDFFARIEALVLAHGGTIVTSSRATGGDATVYQPSLYAPSLEALGRALAAIPNEVDYDTWVKIGAAVKAATDESEDGYELYETWSLQWASNTPEGTRAKWDSLSAPYMVGWPWLSRLAAECSPDFSPAREEFPPVEPPTDEEADAEDRAQALAATDMFGRCVWIERTQLVCDLADMKLLNREAFNWRWANVGSPGDRTGCAWNVFGTQLSRRRTVSSVTYRPGAALFVYEEDEGGMCVNVWRKPDGPLPSSATDEDVQPWLDHLAYLFPSERERTILLDWFAWVIQHQDQKPNYGVLIGSPHQGNGKSILLEPVRYALGKRNVRELSADDLSGGYTDWLIETKLFIVEEMHSFERKSTMNRLKNYLATPPWRLRVNPKYGKQFDVPNIQAGVFFTNHIDSLALEKGDRRFYILWTEVPPRDYAYYAGLTAWFKSGGAAKAARWLKSRDVSTFEALGRAPMTDAKEDMRRTARTLIDEWLEEGIGDATGPFAADLVSIEDVWLAVPDSVSAKGGRPTQQRLSHALRRAGGKAVGRFRLPDETRVSVLALRRHEMYAGVDVDRLRDLFLKQRAEAAHRSEFA